MSHIGLISKQAPQEPEGAILVLIGGLMMVIGAMLYPKGDPARPPNLN